LDDLRSHPSPLLLIREEAAADQSSAADDGGKVRAATRGGRRSSFSHRVFVVNGPMRLGPDPGIATFDVDEPRPNLPYLGKLQRFGSDFPEPKAAALGYAASSPRGLKKWSI
jgi:hypothetical protein